MLSGSHIDEIEQIEAEMRELKRTHVTMDDYGVGRFDGVMGPL